jgi:hypothetical protein
MFVVVVVLGVTPALTVGRRLTPPVVREVSTPGALVGLSWRIFSASARTWD